jgi:hypothetical protein
MRELQDGIIHLTQWLARHRGETTGSNWDWLVQEPALASLLPLIHYSVPDSSLPLSVAARERCAQAYYQTVARNMLIYQELSRILEALHARPFEIRNSKFEIQVSPSAIPTVVIKGAALAMTLYPSIGLRPIGDLDLLVPRARLAEAVACLKTLDYNEIVPLPYMAPDLNRAMGTHVGLDGGKAVALHVDVHWTLVAGEHDRYAASMAWFWEQAEPLNLSRGDEETGSTGAEEHGSEGAEDNSPLPPSISAPLHLHTSAPPLTFTPTANLLYLAAHLMLRHGGAQARLLWFCDLDVLVRRQADRLDWDELLHRTQEFRWAAALHAALRGAQERFSTPLPPGFLDALAETEDSQAVRLVERKADPLQTRSTGIWNAMSSLDWQTRLRLALACVLPSPAYVRWRYRPRPEWLWPLCYLYRWLDILRDNLSTLAKLARRRAA